jgi:hypothetical protein
MYEDTSVRGILKSKAMPRLCETCGRKESAFGMPAEGKARWCDQRFAHAPACATAMPMPPLLHAERKDSWGFSVFRIVSAPACSACITYMYRTCDPATAVHIYYRCHAVAVASHRAHCSASEQLAHKSKFGVQHTPGV